MASLCSRISVSCCLSLNTRRLALSTSAHNRLLPHLNVLPKKTLFFIQAMANTPTGRYLIHEN